MTAPPPMEPPRVARKLLERTLPTGPDGRAILGDLHQELGDVARRRGRVVAHVWYWSQAVALSIGYARLGRTAVERTAQDLRFALRRCVREPGFTAAVVLTLALGIGAGTAIFSVVDAVLLRPLPFPEPDRLVRIWAVNERTGDRYVEAMYSDIAAFSESTRAFSGVSGVSLANRVLLDGRMEQPEPVLVARVTTDFLTTLGITPTLGRPFTTADAMAGGEVALVSQALWERRFGDDPDMLGTYAHLDMRGVEIVGVIPVGLEYPEGVDVWRPLSPDEMRDDDREVQLIARLGSGVDPLAADAEAAGIAARLADATPESHGELGGWIQPVREMMVRDVRTALVTLLGAVGLLLLIACVNTANLLLARSARHGHQIAIRTALGASRARVFALSLTESLVLAALGGTAGVLAGRSILGTMVALSPEIPRLSSVSLDLRVVAVMAAVSALAGVVFGVGPALHAASAPPQASLRDRGGATHGSGRARVLSGLVTLEIALSTVLVAMALLLFTTFRTVLTHDRGFAYDGLLAMQIDPLHPPAGGDETVEYFGRMEDRVRAIPGVRAVALSSHELLEQRGMRLQVEVEGAPPRGDPARATTRIVSNGFFRTAGVPIVSGAGFGAQGGSDGDLELVVNERFVASVMETTPAAALGRRLLLEWSAGRIVGVARDVSPSLGEPVEPIVYVPFARTSLPGMWMLVRTSVSPGSVVPAMREAVREVDRYLLVEHVDVLTESVHASVAPERFNMTLIGAFALLALALAGVGVYGVTAFGVATRRGEIGIRRALGAGRTTVALEVARTTARAALIGIALGLLGAVTGGRLVRALLVDASAADPRVLGWVALTLMVVTLAAAALPLRQATRIDPRDALRD